MSIFSMTHPIFLQLKKVLRFTVNFVKMLLNTLFEGTRTNFQFSLPSLVSCSLPLNPSDSPVPYAIFGDFNFRLDAHRLLQVMIFLERP